MSLWNKRAGPILLWGGEEELMAYPPHIRRAFAWVNADDTRDEKQEAEDEAANKQKYYGDFMRENVLK